MFAGPLSCCLHVERTLAAKVSAPHKRSQRTSNAGKTRWEHRWMPLSPRTSSSPCLCVWSRGAHREKERRPSERWDRKPGFWPEDRELHEVTQPRCWLITITIICSKWFGGGVRMFLFQYLSVFNLLAEFKLSVSPSSKVSFGNKDYCNALLIFGWDWGLGWSTVYNSARQNIIKT